MPAVRSNHSANIKANQCCGALRRTTRDPVGPCMKQVRITIRISSITRSNGRRAKLVLLSTGSVQSAAASSEDDFFIFASYRGAHARGIFGMLKIVRKADLNRDLFGKERCNGAARP
jgi:hypothetical protein